MVTHLQLRSRFTSRGHCFLDKPQLHRVAAASDSLTRSDYSGGDVWLDGAGKATRDVTANCRRDTACRPGLSWLVVFDAGYNRRLVESRGNPDDTDVRHGRFVWRRA